MSLQQVYALTIYMSAGVLIGGRLVEVFFYEWAYYSSHPWHIPAVWLGGMSTHGILLGAVLGIALFCRVHRKSVLAVADELAIAGAYIMGVGRVGNFIDGQIAGAVTDVWWAVQFPDLEGFRHPVVLYDGLKNLLLIPLLLLIRHRHPPRGVLLGHFILWYGFLRIFVDFFREYRTDFLGLPPGQGFNLTMTVLGIVILMWAYRRTTTKVPGGTPSIALTSPNTNPGKRPWGRRFVFLILLLIPMVIPSDWTQDVPERYGARHEGLGHSALYPEIPVATD